MALVNRGKLVLPLCIAVTKPNNTTGAYSISAPMLRYRLNDFGKVRRTADSGQTRRGLVSRGPPSAQWYARANSQAERSWWCHLQTLSHWHGRRLVRRPAWPLEVHLAAERRRSVKSRSCPAGTRGERDPALQAGRVTLFAGSRTGELFSSASEFYDDGRGSKIEENFQPQKKCDADERPNRRQT